MQMALTFLLKVEYIHSQMPTSVEKFSSDSVSVSRPNWIISADLEFQGNISENYNIIVIIKIVKFGGLYFLVGVKSDLDAI